MNKKFYIGICALFLTLLAATLTSQAATITVTNKNNSGAGSLRQAVLDANTSGNISDTIVFATNVRGKIVLTGFEIEINKPIGTNLTIIGPGADVLSIESDLAFRIFRVQLGNIKISGLRISRGNGLNGLNDFGAVGGGIWVIEDANLTLESCSITEHQGIGIKTMSGSTLTINNSLISGNQVAGIEGAGGLSVSNSTIADNLGLGMFWLNGTVTLTNITVSGNQGPDTGGIIFNTSNATILNSTITNNGRVSPTSNVGGLKIENGATVNLKNTIIANNTGLTPDINGSIFSQGYNLVRNRTGGTGFIASDLPNNTNPQLGGFANNGGATYTISLRSTSPAINAGTNTGAPATDQRGVARPQGGTVDIGAYESGVRPAAFGKIVFVSDRNGNREIYSINSDGTNTMRLTTNFTFNDEFPDWSPDGMQIAFSTNRDGNFEIYTMNADGTSPTRLTTNSVPDSEPAWSPDGSKIAFVRNGAGIFLMDANGANQTAIPNTADGASPSWSPDGTQIVYTCVNMGSAICKINADGTNRTPFPFNDAIHTSPAWSPDGNSIAFSIDFDVSPFFYFYNPHNVNVIRPMINAGTGNEVVGFASAFSPDGAKIADGTGNLFLRDADGGNPVLLINSTVSGNGNSFLPDWFGQNTPTGANVSAVSVTTTITFSGVSTGGTTTAVPIDPASAGTLPGGYSLGVGFPAYEITTTASYTAPVTVCIQVPSVTSLAVFNALALFHSEGGVLVNRTLTRDFAMKTICALVNSLSPFVVAENLSPTSANVSVGGRVLTSNGYGISRARVSITDRNGETRWAKTNSFGNYCFDEVPAGETYVISVSHKSYQFNSQVIAVSEDIQNADFTAEPE